MLLDNFLSFYTGSCFLVLKGKDSFFLQFRYSYWDAF